MTLDINSNGSYFYNGKPRKGKNEEENDSEEHKEKDGENDSQSKKYSYEKKKADVSSLDLMGMQNALMIHKESIVHPHNSENKDLSHSSDSDSSGFRETSNNIQEPSVSHSVNSGATARSEKNVSMNSESISENSDNDISEKQVHSQSDISNGSVQNSFDSDKSISDNMVHSNDGIPANIKSVSTDMKHSVDSKSTDNKTGNSDNGSNNTINYNKLGIIQNKDGTFSMKNNPFGKFTKETIEDYINKYIYPSEPDTWVNGYSQIYTIKNQKFFLMKVTLANGMRVFRGTIIEDDILYTIFFGVNEKGLPDENKVLKKR